MIKQDNIIKSKDEILEFLEFYERYSKITRDSRMLVFGFMLGLQLNPNTKKQEEENAK